MKESRAIVALLNKFPALVDGPDFICATIAPHGLRLQYRHPVAANAALIILGLEKSSPTPIVGFDGLDMYRWEGVVEGVSVRILARYDEEAETR